MQKKGRKLLKRMNMMIMGCPLRHLEQKRPTSGEPIDLNQPLTDQPRLVVLRALMGFEGDPVEDSDRGSHVSRGSSSRVVRMKWTSGDQIDPATPEPFEINQVYRAMQKNGEVQANSTIDLMILPPLLLVEIVDLKMVLLPIPSIPSSEGNRESLGLQQDDSHLTLAIPPKAPPTEAGSLISLTINLKTETVLPRSPEDLLILLLEHRPRPIRDGKARKSPLLAVFERTETVETTEQTDRTEKPGTQGIRGTLVVTIETESRGMDGLMAAVMAGGIAGLRGVGTAVGTVGTVGTETDSLLIDPLDGPMPPIIITDWTVGAPW